MPVWKQAEAETIYISGKQAEEVGFEKLSQRLVKLQGIRVLVLDHMRIRHKLDHVHDMKADSIASLCADITELDLSDNLFESFDEVRDLCGQLPRLRTLTLDGNRFVVSGNSSRIMAVRSLALSRTLLGGAELNLLLSSFPRLETLDLADNQIDRPLSLGNLASLTTLDLADNQIESWSVVVSFASGCPVLRTLGLKRNRIASVNADVDIDVVLHVAELDLTYNQIATWAFFDHITTARFPNLKHLRTTGNPVYKNSRTTEGKALKPEDGYMLTIARLPRLESLNYAKISDKERLNSETYYLGQVASELSLWPEEEANQIIARHPRYKELCEEYGEPIIPRRPERDTVDPNSLVARLIAITFVLDLGESSRETAKTWIQEVPKSFSIYRLLGILGKQLNRAPLDLRAVLELSERDPARRDESYNGPEWWDSSDDEGEGSLNGEWLLREQELAPSTRAIGTYVEGNEAIVRLELRHVVDR